MPDFTGVTFANQPVTPADDALVRRALLGDGILTGCEFSYSGYTLTMRSGALIVCGRQIRHPSAQNWAVVGAKSGYARLVLDIDLTKSSTKDLFEQVSTALEYATDEAGFTELIQEDLNVSGSHYQIALCVVSLGEAGITGIVSQLDAAEGGGGGNFSVVGGLTQPTSPKENMIWVKTNVKKAPKYVFAEAAPEAPAEGLIWFLTSSVGAITKTRVYTGGAWVSADAYMYLAGNWVQITSAWNGGLFENGNQYEEYTGGWGKYNNTVTIATTISFTANNSRPYIHTKKAVDMTSYSKLRWEASTGFGAIKVATAPSDAYWGSKDEGDITYAGLSAEYLDISSVNSGYICLGAKSEFFGNNKITKIWLE